MDVYTRVLILAVIILAGYLGGRLFRLLKMPMVVGYLVAGMVLGPSVTGIVTVEMNESLELVKILGLGMIAILIGGELELKKIRHLGRAILGITVVQVIGASMAVFLVMYFILGLPLHISLLLGALATATAPASPVAVIREYEARGPFTSTLLGVVALDDAVAILFFGIVSAVTALLLGGMSFSFTSIIFSLSEVLLSALLGIATGIILTLISPELINRRHKVTVLIGAVLLNSGLAYAFELSPLMVNMVCGFLIANLYRKPAELNFLEDIEMPIILIFFTLAGASLHFNILFENWLWAAAYIIARGFGKVGGAFLGARLSGAEKVVQKYLGFAMLSKAGLTIGLLMLVQDRFPEVAATIVAIELAAVSVCELIGPLGTRYAVLSSGEAKEKPAA
ncbi:MAG TPA: cation:proton antiporter [Firmicutes bacterium]|nr:cation:proton antiporter [Bacillota bacterium]